jgi:glutamate/tyrosine decarboxylase-like PLP-dependent enzyme
MITSETHPFDYRAAFIGPQGENADEAERLLLEVLRDHMMWRRNFHPEDPRLIAEWARTERPYRETVARLRDELYSVLARLKRGAPLHSTRQLGHMVTDPALPALIGYFAGSLYNQNNVVQEAAPETVRCEGEYLGALARMVGYPTLVGQTVDPSQSQALSFGHLTSGGTTANMEVLWIVRNVRFFPLALRLLLAESSDHSHLGLDRLEVTGADGQRGALGDASTADLFNLPIAEIVRLKRETGGLLRQASAGERDRFREDLPTVRRAGMGSFRERYNQVFSGDRVANPVVLVSVSAHYCWQKAMDLTGLGSQFLRQISVDDHIRLDAGALQQELVACRRDGTPVLMVVSICGTTEAASVDPAGSIQELRLQPEIPAFWHHSDAAFGGYLTALVERRDGQAVPYDDLPPEHPGRIVSGRIYDSLVAVAETDSIVLDPHKLGFVPYSSGAVLLREYSVRDAIAYDAPYLAGGPEAGFGGFLGRWTLEGSRAGAAAVSGYLTQSVIPLNPGGHGHLIRQCIRATRDIFESLTARSGEYGIRFIPFNLEPDTMGLCFVLVPEEGFPSLSWLNKRHRRIWKAFSVDESGWNIRRNDYLLSKSEVSLADYQPAIDRMFAGGLTDPSAGRLELLRLLSINPFLSELTGGRAAETDSFVQTLTARLFEVAHEVFTTEGSA